MKAVRIVNGSLVIEQKDRPEALDGQTLVRVRAAGLNRADLLQRQGKYPAPKGSPPDVPGLEFAGEVERAASSSRWSRGQRVFGLCGGGAQAEFIALSDSLLMPTPGRMSDVQGAAVPEAYITAHDVLVTQAGLRRGERLLFHAIASGVGVAALQIAKLGGCTVFGTSRSPAKFDRLKALGADLVCTPDDFVEEIRRAAGAVDVIVDPVGAAYFSQNLELLDSQGRLIVLSTMGGADVTLSLAVLMRKRLRVSGTMLRARSDEEKASAVQAFSSDVLPALDAGTIEVPIDRVFPLDQAGEAYDYLAADRNVGKVVLSV